MISEIKGEIAVLTIAGNYREGKSTILNRMILEIKNGFKVDKTTEACTKGIWIWNKVLL